jgi:hypothetical protein
VFSQVATNKSKLPTITSQVVHVFESCNENAKSIQSFNSTILEFMRQFQSIPTSLGSLGLGGHTSTLDYNVANMVDFSTLLERKGKNLVAKFGFGIGACDGASGLKMSYLNTILKFKPKSIQYVLIAHCNTFQLTCVYIVMCG